MTLSLDSITRIVSTLVREHGRDVALVGVTSTDGGSDRIELLITIAGCHQEPCRLLVNVSRAGEMEFQRELQSKLTAMLASHRKDQQLP